MMVRLTQIDGKLPNLALARLGAWHRVKGDTVIFSCDPFPSHQERNIAYDVVYGSAIFTKSIFKMATLLHHWPRAIIGGTGFVNSRTTIEDITGNEDNVLDYSFWPDYKPSLGFTSRGCRLRCEFCFVPKKEGKPKTTNTIDDIWRGDGHKKWLHLLDNDFFGQARENWRKRIAEIVDGNFKVCFNQGINIRLVDDEIAESLSLLNYRDDQFQRRRLYGAWDNRKHEKIFFRGVELLERHGVKPSHLMIYMLIGFDKTETLDDVMYRFNKLVEVGIKPYPMVYDPSNKLLKRFQRWVVTGLYRAIPFKDYTTSRSIRKKA